MMKKVVLALAAGMIVLPLLAADQKAPADPKNAPVPSVQERHEAFQKQHEERKAQMKATEEKMAKLVKEYKKLSGKKQAAKKAEIAELVSSIRDEQLKFNEQQLVQFEDRLTHMKADLAKNQEPEAKKAWVDEKTTALIENDGDMKALFDRGGQKEGFAKGPQMGRPDKKADGKDGKGFKFGRHMKHDGKLPPPPPPPAEEK